MSRIIVARQNQTGSDEGKVIIKGSTSSLPEAQKERKGASVRRWKSFTRIFDSKKRPRPPSRKASFTIDVSPEF
jgi:hypothetical protein